MSINSIDRSEFYKTRAPCRDQLRYGKRGCPQDKMCPYLHTDDRNALSVIKICTIGRACLDRHCDKFHPQGQDRFRKRGGVHCRRKQKPSNPVAQAFAVSPTASKAHNVFFGNSAPPTQSSKAFDPDVIDAAIAEAIAQDTAERQSLPKNT